MEIKIEKYSGFCFGVKRAIDIVNKLISEKKQNKNIYSIGSIIYNENVINNYKNGMVIIDEEEAKKLKNETVIIRTHGIEKNIYDTLIKNNKKSN